MLIQITNRCRMGCQHCLDDSRPDGGMMSRDTLDCAVRFALYCRTRHVVVSGGEPTEHPDLVEFCRRISDAGLSFSLCSNGMWIGDAEAERRVEEISGLAGYAGMQVYSNPKWYRLHGETVAKFKARQDKWRKLQIVLDTTEIRNMLSVGRAGQCAEAMAAAHASKYHNSCLAACITAVQSDSPAQFSELMTMQAHFCTPMVDWRGDVHMSESWLCPSCGNVCRDDGERLWRGMRQFRPCGKCVGCRKYLSEDTPKMAMARRLLGQDKETEQPEATNG